MRGEPSPNLVCLLARLNLATADEVRGMAARVRRLAGELPDFESVWVDALAGARILTPYQAAEINAGRGDRLLCGPYVISRRLAGSHFAATFAARHLESGRNVRLCAVARPQCGAATAARALAALVERSKPLVGPAACVVESAGMSGERVWAACAAVEGMTAAQWMVEYGRFPPQVVLHLARAMLARLAEFEQLGITHGDLSAGGLLLQASGQAVLPMAGLRAAARPSEGYSFGDLQPEGYDYLAPERIAEGAEPTISSDVYACGCLWWHLLTGRPPFAGGSSLTKLTAVHAARTVNVRQLAPEVPEALAGAIDACMARDPAARPEGFVQLAAILGAPTRNGQAMLSRALARRAPLSIHAAEGRPRRTGSLRRTAVLAAVVGMLIVSLVGLGSFIRAGRPPQNARATANENRSASRVSESENRSLDAARRAIALDDGPRADAPVKLATAIVPAAKSAIDELILPTDKKVRLGKLDLKPGKRVRGRGGKRPLVAVPDEGLTIACDNVCFEGIDFIWEPEDATARKASRSLAMIRLAAQSIELRGCSFSASTDRAPLAISWTGAVDRLPVMGGEIVLADCVFEGLGAIVDNAAGGELSVELNNVLCVASGPIVRLSRPPTGGEAIAVSLERTTARGDSPVLECHFDRLADDVGPISITASDTVLDGNPGGGLLILAGSEAPQRLLGAITWNGQGSMVTPHTAVALWRNGNKKPQVLPEDEMEVAGLVRCEVEFAGRADAAPAASRIVRWQGPLRSADPPGASVERLFSPAK